MLYRLFIKVHRILGTVLSILFLMWFLSGMVMMYHTYPSLSQQQRMEHAETAAVAMLPAINADTVTSIAFERVAGRDICIVGTPDGETVIDIGTNQAVERFTAEELMQMASQWTTATPTLLNILNEIDVWLIGAMPFKEYPIYHYALNDGHGSELYLSSRTGRALQLTDRTSRFWAWVGAIPHWIYITKLRATGRQPWTDTVLWLSGFGIAMTLAGIIVGIRAMILARRRGRCWRGFAIPDASALTPYAKPLFRWHHLFGLCFGLFVLTWIFSGFMSLADAPQLLWPTHTGHSAKDIYAAELHTSRFTLDCNKVLASAKVKRLELMEMGGRPYYHVWTADNDYLVDAAAGQPVPCLLTTEQCRQTVQAAGAHGSRVTATMLTAYDNYYVSQKRPLPLPICRVKIDDADGSTYYIDPRTGACRYYNHNKRAGKWMYTGLHALNTSFFASHPLLRLVILWTLLIGGTVVSATGVLMAFKVIKRKTVKKTTT